MKNDTEVFFKAKGSELTKVLFKQYVTVDGEEKALVFAQENYYVVDLINLIADEETMAKLENINDIEKKMKPLSDELEELRDVRQALMKEIAEKYKEEVEDKESND